MTTRRKFVQSVGAAAATGPVVLSNGFMGASEKAGAAEAKPKEGAVTSGAPASERIRLGVVGIGPRCRYVLGGMLQHSDVECVAIADVQENRRVIGKKLVDNHYGNSNCELVKDFRTLLDRNDIDAVLVATGDRWHATASMMAAEAGKDIYSEKPCGITIDLCRRLSETIERTGRVFQAGTQRRSVANFKQAVDFVHAGGLGKLKQLHATVYTPEMKTTWLTGQPTPAKGKVDWNLWLGPAPWRPFHQDYVDGRWRGYYDFDSGARLLDWGAHTVDICQWGNQSDDTIPKDYQADKTGVTATYEDGVTLRLHFLETPFGKRPGWVQSLGTCPVRFEGENGTVEVGDSGGIVFQPHALAKDLPKLPVKASGLDVLSHSRNFLDCVKSRAMPAANHIVMRRSHTAAHAAALSWILGRKLTMDPRTEMFVDDPEANRLRTRPERDWS